MITASILQTAYNKLYSEFRNYVWNFDIVELLAELEIKVYQTFPDMDEVKNKFQKLKRQVGFTDAFQDELLKDTFDNFEDIAYGVDSIYVNLKSFKEVVML